MPLTSAEKQARYRARNVVLLTGDAHTIADKLMEMEEQAKLIQIVTILKGRIDPTDGRCRWVKDDGGRRGSGTVRTNKTPSLITQSRRVGSKYKRGGLRRRGIRARSAWSRKTSRRPRASAGERGLAEAGEPRGLAEREHSHVTPPCCERVADCTAARAARLSRRDG